MGISVLTKKYDKTSRDIKTHAEVETVLDRPARKVSTIGIWDTGATDSVITKELVNQLGLLPVSRAVVNGVHGSREVNVYYVNICLNNGDIQVRSSVTECEKLSDDGSVGLLIGMNVITMGDFSISNHQGKTVMSFRVPSLCQTDYVAELREYKKLLKIHKAQSRVGNELCPCRSGKQWKNCHGKSIYAQK